MLFPKINIFLYNNEQKIVVERGNIWSIDEQPSSDKREFDNPLRCRYDFLHPASMTRCPKRRYGIQDQNATQISIVPQEYISDPVTIKRKLDEVKKTPNRTNAYPQPKILGHS